MKLYIANSRSNCAVACTAAIRLRNDGHSVICPSEAKFAPIACMRTDIRKLVTCDAIFLLPGWGASKDATLEHHIASALGMVVLLEIPILETI